MGWLWLGAIGCAAFLLLRVAGVPRAIGWFAGAALMLGATGYALQQRAALAGHPVAPDAEAIEIDPGLVAFRQAIMPGLPGDAATLAIADDRLRAGQAAEAAHGLLDAIAARPRDAALWTGLGGAIGAQAGGQVSPGARFAFARAIWLAPDQPGPPFFLGMAYAEAGELAAAKTAWLRALALTPRGSPIRVDIAERLALVDDAQAMNGGR